MDKRDEMILSLAFALQARWTRIKSLRAIGDAQRAAIELMGELDERGIRLERDDKKRDAPKTPG